MSFGPPACEGGHDTNYGKSRERNWKKPASCACTKEQAFSNDVRRQPGTAISGSSLLSLYPTYVQVRASAGKAVWALLPSSVLPFCRRRTKPQSGMGAPAVVCLPFFCRRRTRPQSGVALRRRLFRSSYSACSCDPSPFSSSRSPSSSVTTLSTDSPYRLWKVTSML